MHLECVGESPFSPFLCYWQKINARNINYMAVLNFQPMPRTEPKWQFSDTLLVSRKADPRAWTNCSVYIILQ